MARSRPRRRTVELAHAETDEITTRARTAAEQHWTDARQAADRLRRHRKHLAEDFRAAEALLADIEPLLQPLSEKTPENALVTVEVIHQVQRPREPIHS
ncbi:hypothetical protein [Lentzea sp.]|uniref:hypothetical protein n=1 Tax=Lentzea sp. TaxID=56099 RepID=UPI002BA81221|nr:hypothetical protein [Lentzea sp.]HUQ61548.1 hypothetical protein [Lentzea sp.]